MTKELEDWMIRAIRAESALRAIRTQCEQAVMGAWRGKIAAIVDMGLDQ